jgi:hypothetical protein
MHRRKLVNIFTTVLSLALLGGCQTGFKRSFRFRMTVEVMTSHGLKTGSAVYEVYAAPVYDPMAYNHSVNAGAKGQAAIVDLPEGPLFVLAAEGDGRPDIVDATFRVLTSGDTIGTDDFVSGVGRLGHEHIKAELPKSVTMPGGQQRFIWPPMVRFRDINDPGSVENVDPVAVGVRHIWVETTHDPVTTGIEKRFPHWFADFNGRRMTLSGKSADMRKTEDLADQLSPSAFSTEIEQK